MATRYPLPALTRSYSPLYTCTFSQEIMRYMISLLFFSSMRCGRCRGFRPPAARRR